MARSRQPICPSCKINLKAPGQGYCSECRRVKAKAEDDKKVKSIRPIREYLNQPGPAPQAAEATTNGHVPEPVELMHPATCLCVSCRVKRDEIPQAMADRLRCRSHGILDCPEVRCQLEVGLPA